MTVYTSSVLRAAAPFLLKINYSCYFYPCVSNSILPSGVLLPPLSPISAFVYHFLPVFYSSCLFGFPPISFTRSFDSLYLLGFGLCSGRSSSNCSCMTLVFNICKENLSLNEVYRKSLPTGFRRGWSSWLISPMDSQKISKGIFWGSSCNAHQFSFPRQFQVYCKDIGAAVPALQGTSRLLRIKWLKNTSVTYALLVAKAVLLTGHQIHCTIALQYHKYHWNTNRFWRISCVNTSGKKLAFGHMWAALVAFNCHAPTSDGDV